MVTGLLYDDKNGNASQDEGEPGIAGAQVTLTDGKRSVAFTRIATTNGNGVYTLIDVPVGQYTLQVELPAGQTSANIPPLTVNVTSKEPVTVPSTPIEVQYVVYLPATRR